MLSLSPCHFKMLEKSKNLEKNGLEVLARPMNRRTKNILHNTSTVTYMDVVDWSTHDEVIAALSRESHSKEDEEVAYKVDNGKGLQNLIKAWFLAQVDAISSSAGVEVNSLFLGIETLVHFEVKGYKFGPREDALDSSNGFVGNGNKTIKLPIEILYALIIPEESRSGGNVYELVFDEMNKGPNNLQGALLEKLESGDPVTFNCVKDRIFDEGVTTDISSLSWMGTTASDIINSRFSFSSLKFVSFFFMSFFPLFLYLVYLVRLHMETPA